MKQRRYFNHIAGTRRSTRRTSRRRSYSGVDYLMMSIIGAAAYVQKVSDKPLFVRGMNLVNIHNKAAALYEKLTA